MKVILITSPIPVAGEAEILTEALRAGIFRLHLRRPSWSEREMARLLDALPEELLPQVVLQDQQQLARAYPVGGIHFNHRYPYQSQMAPLHSRCGYSISCHSLEEVQMYHSEMDYLFLSPIFDSISKVGYRSRFAPEELQQAGTIISPKVFALGGITLERLPLIHSIPFGGVALLGDFWQRVSTGDHLHCLSTAVPPVPQLHLSLKRASTPTASHFAHTEIMYKFVVSLPRWSEVYGWCGRA